MWSTTVLTLFDKGGPVMWPLLIASVIGLAIVLERCFFFLCRRLPSRRFEADVLQLLRTGQTHEALDLAAGSRHPVAHITRTYLENLDCGDSLRQDILQREGSRALEAAESNLRGLSLIAHLAPLMGLLGTVTGLVGAFAVIEQMDGMAQPGQLAAGIWESLLTTVTGLVIALPCLAAFYWFEHKADRLARHMKFMISELNELFGKRQIDLQVEAAEGESVTVVKS
jgi:biopolymer transport protein ExbB